MQLDHVKSSSHAVTCGIPQGSVLGPLHPILIQMTSPRHASTKFDFNMYADDTTLTFTLENIGNITDIANLECELSETS